MLIAFVFVSVFVFFISFCISIRISNLRHTERAGGFALIENDLVRFALDDFFGSGLQVCISKEEAQATI